MRIQTRPFAAFAFSLLTLGLAAAPCFGQFKVTITVNCTRGDSLANVAANALPNTIINIKGACAGPSSSRPTAFNSTPWEPPRSTEEAKMP